MKQELSGIQETTFFGVNNFKYLSYEADLFFSKCSTFYVDFNNAIKTRENVFGFEDNCV